MKTCRKCGVELIAGENWYKSYVKKCDYICKECRKAYGKAYYEANKAEVLAHSKEYYEAHKEEIAARKKAWREAHKEEIAARKKAWRETHKEEIAAHNRDYYEAHKKEIIARVEKWQSANPDKVAAYKKAWQQANLNKVAEYEALRRARKVENRTEPYERSVIFEQYGGECVYCGAEATQLDHVVPIAEGGADAPDNVVPACAHCNLTKQAQPMEQWLAGHQLELI